MNYGSSLELIIRERLSGRVLYTEPITFTKTWEYNLDSQLDAFRVGVEGAFQDLERDIKDAQKFQEFKNFELEKEMRRRGYAVIPPATFTE